MNQKRASRSYRRKETSVVTDMMPVPNIFTDTTSVPDASADVSGGILVTAAYIPTEKSDSLSAISPVDNSAVVLPSAFDANSFMADIAALELNANSRVDKSAVIVPSPLDSNVLLVELAALKLNASGLELLSLINLSYRMEKAGMERLDAQKLADLFAGNVSMEEFGICVPEKQLFSKSLYITIKSLSDIEHNDCTKRVIKLLKEIYVKSTSTDPDFILHSRFINNCFNLPINDIIPLQWLLASIGHRPSSSAMATILRKRAAVLSLHSDAPALPGPTRIANFMLKQAAQWDRLSKSTVNVSANNGRHKEACQLAMAADPGYVELMRGLLISSLLWVKDDMPGPSGHTFDYYDGKETTHTIYSTLCVPNLDADNQVSPTPCVVISKPVLRVVVAQPKAGPYKGFEILSSGVRVILASASGNEIWGEMQARFPWCAAANSVLAGFAEIARRGDSSRGVRIPPLLLVGPPGCGKTRWARTAANAAGIPFQSVSFSGSNTSTLVNGTEAGWSSARPCLAAAAMRDLDCANPFILVDEVDKTSSSRNNGNSIDALLPMLERETAARFPDSCMLAPLDASRISWVLTANSIKHLPVTLLSRVRVVEMLPPPIAMLAGVLESMREDIANEWGVDCNSLPELETSEIKEVMRAYASTPDLRPLRRRIASAMRLNIWSPPETALRH